MESNLSKKHVADWAIRGLLLLAVAIVFLQTVRHDFVNYDDAAYLLTNQKNVAGGLTFTSIAWAFTTNHCGMWGPITWLSHLLDCQLYGFQPWGHHLTNLLIHAASTLLLFEVLRRMTGDIWPSALAAMLFAIHPLHVETVAWVAERKGLLSGLFFILTLLAYERYVRRPFSLGNYGLVAVCFALSLMAKPAAVTLPFLLLLLDYWPLRRIVGVGVGSGSETNPEISASSNPQFASPDSLAPGVDAEAKRHTPLKNILLEKLPLLLLAAAACAAAPLTQGGAVVSTHVVSIGVRLANALVAYMFYLEKFFWPTGLAAIYLHSGHYPPLWQIVRAAVMLLAISAAAVAWRRRWPWLFVGWFWFVGMLVPMLGLVQLGSHSMADRYTYITQIGLYIVIAWSLARLVAETHSLRIPCCIAATAAVIAFMAAAWVQTTHWRNSQSLWIHAVNCHHDNGLAFDYLGWAFLQDSRPADAKACYFEALECNPHDLEALARLGYIFAKEEKYAEAADYYRRASALMPKHVGLLNKLALASVKCGRVDDAVDAFRKALAIAPSGDARQNLEMAIAEQRKKTQKINTDSRQ